MSETALVPDSREVLRAHARSFHLASLFLPVERRDAAAVLYAFCRLVDDTADEAVDPDAARRDLEQLRLQVKGSARPTPLVSETVSLLDRGGCGIEPALHLIEGVLGDLGEVQVADDGELLRYGYRVAGTVGLMMCAALGVEDRDARAFAVDLGVAMQITNICRDVLEDAGRGRVYLPASRLREAGTSPEALLSGTADRKAVAVVVRDLLDLADRYYASADQGMRFIPARSRLAIVVASRVYREIGEVLRDRGGDALAGRAWVGGARKAWTVVRAAGAALWLSLGGSASHDVALHGPLQGLPGTGGAV